MSYFIIGDEDTVLGFRLGGISGKTVSDRAGVMEALSSVRMDRKVKVILITERMAQLTREEVDRILETMEFPLILEIPDREGPLPGRQSIKDLVKSAIGLSI